MSVMHKRLIAYWSILPEVYLVFLPFIAVITKEKQKKRDSFSSMVMTCFSLTRKEKKKSAILGARFITFFLLLKRTPLVTK